MELIHQAFDALFGLLGGRTRGSATSEFRLTVMVLVVGVVLVTLGKLNAAEFIGLMTGAGAYAVSRGQAKTELSGAVEEPAVDSEPEEPA